MLSLPPPAERRIGPPMEQQIHFCTASDGVSIAYATVGEGPPLVYVCGWPQHLELEWEKPFSRGFLERLARGCTLVRYDMRGSGLSDTDVSDLSLESFVRDLEAVVDHLALERFALLAFGALAGPIAMTYAASRPERVSHLMLHSAYLRGSDVTTPERARAQLEYVAAFGLPMADLIDHPDTDIAQQRDFRELQKAAAPRKVQAAVLRAIYSADLSGLVDRLSMPTLILHGRRDPLIPFAAGRELAVGMPQARFVPFESKTGALWVLGDVLIPEVYRFLGLTEDARSAAQAAGPVTILFTDVEGSTALTERLGDAGAREVLRQHERIVRECLKAHGGSEVKTMGDGFMASFGSAAQAGGGAVAIPRAVAGGGGGGHRGPRGGERGRADGGGGGPVGDGRESGGAHRRRGAGRGDTGRQRGAGAGGRERVRVRGPGRGGAQGVRGAGAAVRGAVGVGRPGLSLAFLI